MPDKTLCPFCKRVGFVRQERVIKGETTKVANYCGSCDRSWDTKDEVQSGASGAERSKLSS